MPRLTRDPLLAAATAILVVCIAILIFAMVMVLIGLGAIFTVARGELLAELATAGAPDSAFWAIAAVLVLAEGMLLAALRFMFELKGIVRSVHQGDPFQPENANRLSRMGWLTIALYGLGISTGVISAWLASVAREADPLDFDLDVGLDGGGILLILVLFILARVFRQGAAMREDLEGTV